MTKLLHTNVGDIMKYDKLMPLHDPEYGVSLGQLVRNKNWMVTESNQYWTGYSIHICHKAPIKKNNWCYDEILNTIFKTDGKSDLEYINKSKHILKVLASNQEDMKEQIYYYPDGHIIGGLNSYNVIYNIPDMFILHFINEYNKGNQLKYVNVDFRHLGGTGSKYVPKFNTKNDIILDF